MLKFLSLLSLVTITHVVLLSLELFFFLESIIRGLLTEVNQQHSGSSLRVEGGMLVLSKEPDAESKLFTITEIQWDHNIHLKVTIY